jgi:UV DNA damage repair endonuclease
MIEKDAFGLCRDTWRGYRPLFHYSESREGKNPRAHADYVKQLPDTYGLDDIDIDFEFKMKDKAFININ